MSIESNLNGVSGSSIFPLRKQVRELPQEISNELIKQLITTMSQYYVVFTPNQNNIRIYFSNYGIVKPHVDKPVYPDDTHTCLIYITDDFNGGNLTIKLPTTNIIKKTDNIKGKFLNITCEPRICYGVIFPKNTIHFTDELLSGNKLILLIDCKIN